MESVRQIDVAVVGAGLAGSTAALRAAELGCTVALLEQGPAEAYPCNSRFAGGIIHVAYHDPKDPADTILASIEAATAGEADADQAASIARNGARTIDWLQGHGAKFMRFSPVAWHRWCMAPPRPIGYGLDWKGRGPDQMLRNLAERFRARGGETCAQTRAVGLRRERDGFELSAERSGAALVFKAKAVVIADGGFQANPDLFREYIGPRPERVRQRNAGVSRGDGLRMAKSVGAQLVRMNAFYGHLLHLECLQNDNLWPYPQFDELVASTIMVDRSGRRFLDEGIGGIKLANVLAASDDPARATVILDAEIWEGPGKYGRIPLNPHLERAGGTIHAAGTIEELATRTQIDPVGLRETVDSWNAAVAKGDFSALCPSRTTEGAPGKLENMKPWSIRTPPFRAMPICPGITHTMGGILIDGEARVLDDARAPIARLFAAGTATGGLEGGMSVGYTGGLSKACVFGLLAGEGAAATAKS